MMSFIKSLLILFVILISFIWSNFMPKSFLKTSKLVPPMQCFGGFSTLNTPCSKSKNKPSILSVCGNKPKNLVKWIKKNKWKFWELFLSKKIKELLIKSNNNSSFSWKFKILFKISEINNTTIDFLISKWIDLKRYLISTSFK